MTAHNKDNKDGITEKVAQAAQTVREKVEELSDKAKKEFHEADFDHIKDPVIRVVEDAKVKADALATDVKDFASKAQDTAVWKDMEENRTRNLIILGAVLALIALLFMRRR